MMLFIEKNMKTINRGSIEIEVNMIDKTLRDETQIAILPHLRLTEALVANAIKKETGKDSDVCITAMPDLGFANNSIRMKGGFFTGMYLEWNSIIPFVPIDATVNSCGVSIFLLNKKITSLDLEERINIARKKSNLLGYNWNFERGNHFISLCQIDEEKYCVVMHASADEYKKSLPKCSLYPIPSVWYYRDIKTEFSSDRKRYLRYLTGSSAEKFISIAIDLEVINRHRMQAFAELIFGKSIQDELFYIPHYGMPTMSSIAIGCSWKTQKSILLTLPGKDIFVIVNNNNDTARWLTPHGFGATAVNPTISYTENEFYINRIKITDDGDVRKIPGKNIRHFNSEDVEIENHIQRILEKCNATIASRIHPLITVKKGGFTVYEK